MLIELLATLAWSGEATVSLDGRTWSGLRASADAAELRAIEARRGPAPWVTRRRVWVSQQGGGLRVEATWTVLAPTPGRFEAHLAAGLDVASVEVDGRPWGASLGADRSPIEDISVVVSGRAEIHLVGTVEVSAAMDASFALLPGAGTVDLAAGLDLLDVPAGAASLGGVWYASGAPLHVGPPCAATDERASVLMTARAAVGVTVGDAEITVHGRVSWALRRGQVSMVSVSAPGAGRDLSVTGAHVASTSRVGDRIDVTLTEPADASVTVELTWTEPIAAGASASVPLPQITPVGALSIERVVSVARDTDVEVVPRFERGEPLANEALPDWADGLITGTPTAARRGEATGRIDLLRFVPADRPPMVVDVAEWFVAAAGDGRMIAQGTLSVRNERASSLRIGLRPGMRLLAVQVEGKPVAAVTNPGGWRIPLPRSVETMRGLLSFPVELTVIGTDDAAWSDGRDATVALPVIDAEVAVRRVTLNLPRGAHALGGDGEEGRVAAFSEGDGLAYGFAAGVDQARASALYQDALGAWMKNDFDAAQERLDELKEIGGDNENVNRLQSNLDLVGGQVESTGDEALARRLKDQARARSLDEEQKQEDVLRYADDQLAAGNDEVAAKAYAAAAETADKLAQLEQSESQDQRERSRDAKKKEAEAQTRNRRTPKGRGSGLAGSLGSFGASGMGMGGSGEGGGGAGYFSYGSGAVDTGAIDGDVGGEWGGLLSPSAPRLLDVEPALPAPAQDRWETTTTAATQDAPPAMGCAGLAEHELPTPRVATEPTEEREYRETVEVARGETQATDIVMTARAARPAPHGMRGTVSRGDASPRPPARVGATRQRGPISTMDFEEDDVEGALEMPSGSAATASAARFAGPTPAAAPKPVDALAPLEVTATSAAVVVPALGETVRFQQLLLPPGADVPVTIRVDLPRRFP